VGAAISAAHINGILAEPRAELVYCVDVDEARAQARAEKAGAKAATDYLSILDEVDAVDICTPPHLHARMAINAPGPASTSSPRRSWPTAWMRRRR